MSAAMSKHQIVVLGILESVGGEMPSIDLVEKVVPTISTSTVYAAIDSLARFRLISIEYKSRGKQADGTVIPLERFIAITKEGEKALASERAMLRRLGVKL